MVSITYSTRLLGWQLGREQRMLHDQWPETGRIQDAALHNLARMAWQFEPHGVANVPYLRRLFVAGYRQGYQLDELRGRQKPRSTHA